MPAYLIAEVDVHDAESYEAYKTRAAAAVSGQLVVELRDPATFSWRSQPTASAAE